MEEEELWLRLDDALLEAMRNPALAWSIAWMVVKDADAGGFENVLDATVMLLDQLLPSEFWDLESMAS